jgi:nucleoid DNA-binding protein
MIQNTGMVLGLYQKLSWLAQIPLNQSVNTRDQAAAVFSGPRFFIALIAGVVLAFAFQLLLTNLSVAAGISVLGHLPNSNSDNNESASLGGTIRKIGTAVGIWTLITVTIALFVACLLAVQLSLIGSAGKGAILGLVIWATYFCLLVWVSSTTVGSLIGSVVNTATAGMQAIMGTATAALGAKAVNNQVVATAEAAAAAVRRELGSAIDPGSIRDSIEDYIDMLKPPELDLSKIRSEFENLLNDPQLKSIAGTPDLRNIDRQKFVDLVSSRTDLSKRDINRIVDQLESVWRQVVAQQQPAQDRMGELIDYLKSVQPGQARVDELNTKVDQLIAEMRSAKQADQTVAQDSGPGPIQQTLQSGLNTLVGIVMGRADLSDLDVDNILRVISDARQKVTQQAGKVADKTPMKSAAVPYSTVRADVENYLLNTYSWQMKPEKIAQEFRDVLYDPAADPGTVRQELEQLSKNDFVELLQQRGLLTQNEITRIADQLESIRKEVLATVTAAQEREATQALQRRVESYLLTTNKANLTAESIKQSFKPLLEDSDADYETLSRRFALLDRESLRQVLLQRNDMTVEETEAVLSQLEEQRNQVLVQSQGLTEQAKYQAETLWLNLESYLRNTGKQELNPDSIRADLRTLLADPQAGVGAIQARLSRFDRDTLVQLLNQREDLNEDQINQVLDQVESVWSSVRYAPQAVVSQAKDQYDQVTTTLADYLRNTGKEELNPEGIQRDLAKLFENPQEGALALRSRLAQVDRDTLVKLLAQRQDLSEAQINQVIDQVQSSMRDIVRAPRRLAARTQQRVQNFQNYLEDYLRNTGKEELNPEGIRRDLQLLLNDPRAGLEGLSERLSQFDRSTVTALLQMRGDISEEEANRIVGQVLAVRDNFVEQVRAIQRRIQDVVDGIFARIRNYLNSLDRPELNYDSIKRDVRKLFNDPQAGFEALRDRLGSFNRDTLVALVSSREDISEADANRLIDQIEGARNAVLQRAEGIQHEAQRRLEQVKLQAQRQAEETRKAAASAAWWLFGTAIVSAAASAIAGAIAIAILP